MKYFLSLLLSLLSISLWSQTKIDPNFHIYILIGQSNMAGRGEMIEPFASEQHERVQMLNAQNKFVQAKHPMHFDKPSIVGVGPGLRFGIEMAEHRPDIKIGLIPCAVGGTSINSWKIQGYDEATKTHPLDDAIQRIMAAKPFGVIKGIIWHQGESDSSPQARIDYIPKLQALIRLLRELIQQPNLPFVAGELGYFNSNYQEFNQILTVLNSPNHHTALVSAQGLEAKADNIHFNSSSANILGKRYAEAMLRFP
ncbi:sialate O-acetylesterase [Aquirufa rosea]|uniref:Sialate O-acetylesterase n=1 Tax=Aquirufa rosea TaxID=2509241 RepID=A0A4Q1C0U1_9BACT|nr:sialate O-acetylesterase [Aquirufa rosea]RXK50664.1 sialate O-acetylesterase [Aquirufa rosea]